VVDSQEERRDAEPGHRDYESCEPTWKHEAQALNRCKARGAERKEHRPGCTERGCKLDRDSIGLCCDVSKLKVGKKMPGSAIPIVHDNDIGPGWDFGIVLPWNLSDFLIDKFRRSGISLVFPIQGRLITKEGNIENLD